MQITGKNCKRIAEVIKDFQKPFKLGTVQTLYIENIGTKRDITEHKNRARTALYSFVQKGVLTLGADDRYTLRKKIIEIDGKYFVEEV